MNWLCVCIVFVYEMLLDFFVIYCFLIGDVYVFF